MSEETICLKIKQMGERFATAGVHLGGPVRQRKLMPGEVLELPKSLTATVRNGKKAPLYQVLLDTGKVEITLEAPNRPLKFANAKEALLTAGTYKPRDDNDANQVELAKQDVAERMAAQNQTAATEAASEESEAEEVSPAAPATRRKKTRVAPKPRKRAKR